MIHREQMSTKMLFGALDRFRPRRAENSGIHDRQIMVCRLNIEVRIDGRGGLQGLFRISKQH